MHITPSLVAASFTIPVPGRIRLGSKPRTSLTPPHASFHCHSTILSTHFLFLGLFLQGPTQIFRAPAPGPAIKALQCRFKRNSNRPTQTNDPLGSAVCASVSAFSYGSVGAPNRSQTHFGHVCVSIRSNTWWVNSCGASAHAPRPRACLRTATRPLPTMQLAVAIVTARRARWRAPRPPRQLAPSRVRRDARHGRNFSSHAPACPPRRSPCPPRTARPAPRPATARRACRAVRRDHLPCPPHAAHPAPRAALPATARRDRLPYPLAHLALHPTRCSSPRTPRPPRELALRAPARTRLSKAAAASAPAAPRTPSSPCSVAPAPPRSSPPRPTGAATARAPPHTSAGGARGCHDGAPVPEEHGRATAEHGNDGLGHHSSARLRNRKTHTVGGREKKTKMGWMGSVGMQRIVANEKDAENVRFGCVW